jgi:dTDP-4-amino-4,6-dideoxygalactose transaminase
VINLENIPLSIPFLNGKEWEYIKECLDTNWVSSVGKYVEKFEEDMADYVGTDYAVATVNGTAALHMALKVLGVEAGDKVAYVPSGNIDAVSNLTEGTGGTYFADLSNVAEIKSNGDAGNLVKIEIDLPGKIEIKELQ